MGDRHADVVAFLLWVDRSILLYILPVDFFLSVAVVALLSRGRRPLELLSLFLLCFVLVFAASGLLFRYGFQHPFVKLEVHNLF